MPENPSKKKANRRGVFIGAYVPFEVKAWLERRARLEHRTLSNMLSKILQDEMNFLHIRESKKP